MKTISGLFICSLLAATCAHATLFSANRLQFGDNTSGSDKVLEFKIGSGTANPKLKYSIDNGFQIAPDGVTFQAFGAASSSGFEPEFFVLSGMLSAQYSLQEIDGTRYAENPKTLRKIRVCASDYSNGGGVVVVKANYGTAKVSNTTVTLSVTASLTGGTTCVLSSPAAAMVTGDQMSLDLVSATGTAENLTVKYIF